MTLDGTEKTTEKVDQGPSKALRQKERWEKEWEEGDARRGKYFLLPGGEGICCFFREKKKTLV